MSKFRDAALLAALMLGTSGPVAFAEGEAGAGQKVFAKCKACHLAGEGAKHRVGPHLNEIIGRRAGSLDDFKYAPAMVAAGDDGLVWSKETLKAFLQDPKAVVKGTKMAFAGLKSDDDIADLIAFLTSFSPQGVEAQVESGAEGAEQPQSKSTASAPSADMAHVKAGPVDRPQHGVLHLGRVATEEEIAAWDIDVRPDGTGLPEGRGTVAEGEPIFEASCATCHGDFGEGTGRWPVLAGGDGTLKDERPVKTIGSYWPYLSTVYDYVRRSMPFGDARSLSDDDVYALTAYLLYLNDVVTDEDFELSKENFASLRLPNEDNFIDDDRTAEEHADKSEPCMTDCRPGKPTIAMHSAVLDVTPDADADEEGSPSGID
jgi:cytochrome c